MLKVVLSVLLLIMRDLEEGLLPGRGKKQSKETKRRFDECELKVRSLRTKNNELQKQCENELDSDIRQAVKEQGYYMEVLFIPSRDKLEK